MASSYSVGKLRRAMLHFVSGRAVQAVARAGLVLLVVRLLPSDDYGAYMLVIGVAEMLLQFSSFGVLSVGQRFLPELVDSAAPSSTRRFVGAILGLQFVMLLVLCGAAWWAWETLLPHVGFTAEQIERSRPALLLFMTVPAFRFVADLLDTLLEQGRSQSVRALMPLGRIGGVAALVTLDVEVTLERVLLLDVAVTAVCLALSGAFLFGCLLRLPTPPNPKPLPLAAMRRHAWNMAAVEVMGTAQAPGALRIVLANSLGIAESGLFAFLQSLQRVIGRFLPGVLLKGLIRPMMISRAGGPNGAELLEQGMALLLKVNLLVIAAGTVLAVVAGDDIVRVASGGKFTDAGETFVIMLLTLALMSQRQLLDLLMQVLNQTHILRATAFLAPPALVVVWLLADHGLNVALLVTAAGIGVVNAVTLWRLSLVTDGYRIGWWGTSAVVLPPVAAAGLGLVTADMAGPWAAMAASMALLGVLLLVAKPFAPGELRIAIRGVGPLAGRAMEPFVRRSVI